MLRCTTLASSFSLWATSLSLGNIQFMATPIPLFPLWSLFSPHFKSLDISNYGYCRKLLFCGDSCIPIDVVLFLLECKPLGEGSLAIRFGVSATVLSNHSYHRTKRIRSYLFQFCHLSSHPRQLPLFLCAKMGILQVHAPDMPSGWNSYHTLCLLSLTPN